MKKFIYMILFMFLEFAFTANINAGSLVINGSSSVYGGNTIKISVK